MIKIEKENKKERILDVGVGSFCQNLHFFVPQGDRVYNS